MASPRFQSKKDEDYYRTLVSEIMAYQSKADRNANKSLDFRDIEKQLQLLGSAVAAGASVANRAALQEELGKVKEQFLEIKRVLNGVEEGTVSVLAEGLLKPTSKLGKAVEVITKKVNKDHEDWIKDQRKALKEQTKRRNSRRTRKRKSAKRSLADSGICLPRQSACRCQRLQSNFALTLQIRAWQNCGMTCALR